MVYFSLKLGEREERLPATVPLFFATAMIGADSLEKKGMMSSQISTTGIAIRFVIAIVIMSGAFFGSAGTQGPLWMQECK